MSLEMRDLAVGTAVDVRMDDGEVRRTRTRSAPWQLGSGHWVVLLEGISGGYSMKRVRPSPEADRQEEGR